MRLWVSDHKNNYNMPLNEYRDTVVSLESVLEQVIVAFLDDHESSRKTSSSPTKDTIHDPTEDEWENFLP